jgi:predicted AAA+ superfamily ATPase
LWEHLVLNELHAHVGRAGIRYWRTKHGSEIDFVVVRPGRPPVAVECKWSSNDFDPAAMKIFRSAYPGGASFVVTADTRDAESYERRFGALTARFVAVRDLVLRIQESP